MTPHASPPPPAGGGFDAALARLDGWWTRVEVALCAVAALALVLALACWVVVKGLACRTTDEALAGVMLRGLLDALVLGLLAARFSKRRPAVVVPAVVLGLASGVLWRNLGLDYFGNLMAWLQDGSWLTLTGGLRGLGTRLTLWLALLGGSLATATGRQVTVDLVTRSLGPRVQKPVAIAMGALAAAVCLSSAWGFFDFLAIEGFRAQPSASRGERVAAVAHGVGQRLFVLRRQLALDLKVAPCVLAGRRWDATLAGAEWNAWLDSADWAAQVGPEAAAAMREADPGSTRLPLASLPGEPARGLLLRTLDLVVPFGLLMIGLRFLLWCLRRGPVEESHAPAPAAGQGAPP